MFSIRVMILCVHDFSKMEAGELVLSDFMKSECGAGRPKFGNRLYAWSTATKKIEGRKLRSLEILKDNSVMIGNNQRRQQTEVSNHTVTVENFSKRNQQPNYRGE